MKRILFLLAALALPTTLLGQGQVSFANTSATLFRTNTIGGSIGLISGVNSYRIGLYIAPDGTVNESMFTLIAVTTNSSLVAGRIGPKFVDIAGNNGTAIAYQVKAWSLQGGSSYEEAIIKGNYVFSGVYTGKSPIGRLTPAVGGGPPTALFTSTAGVPEYSGQLVAGIDLHEIEFLGPVAPEPSTYALAALGVLVILCCQKRRTTNL